jgi:hypothetical protein
LIALLSHFCLSAVGPTPKQPNPISEEISCRLHCKSAHRAGRRSRLCCLLCGKGNRIVARRPNRLQLTPGRGPHRRRARSSPTGHPLLLLEVAGGASEAGVTGNLLFHKTLLQGNQLCHLALWLLLRWLCLGRDGCRVLKCGTTILACVDYFL